MNGPERRSTDSDDGVTVGNVHLSAAVVAAILMIIVYTIAWTTGHEGDVATLLTTILGILGYGIARDIQKS